MQDYGGTHTHTIILSILNNKHCNPVNLLKSAWKTSMHDPFQWKVVVFFGEFQFCFYKWNKTINGCSFHDNMLTYFVQIPLYLFYRFTINAQKNSNWKWKWKWWCCCCWLQLLFHGWFISINTDNHISQIKTIKRANIIKN